jgi:hypothetical protein
MSVRRSATNPFYVLLVVLGIAFALTACAYTVMTLTAVRRHDAPEPSAGGAALLEFLDRHGAELMGGELALLALATVAAIATDRYWMRRAYDEHRRNQSTQPPSNSENGANP